MVSFNRPLTEWEFAEEVAIELIDVDRLHHMLSDLFGEVESSETRDTYDAGISEICPLCGSELVIRTALRGSDVGSSIYGCSSHPRCRFT